MNIEVSKLWLNGSVLSTTETQAGVRSADFRTYTFFVNMRVVLGETLFRKYDAFKCFINQYNIANGGSSQTTATMYQNGLNLVNASYQGNTAGYNIAVNAYNITTIGIYPPPINYFYPQNTREFTMIKPTENLVPLTFSIVSDDGTTTAISAMMWQLTFCPIPTEPEKIYKNPFNKLFQNSQANFTLSTQILTTGATNAYGTMNAARTQFTFSNVDMRRIIGTLWDKYDKFNLVFNSIGIGQSASLSASQRPAFFQMSGLQFINTGAVKSSGNLTQGLAWSPVFLINSTSTADTNVFDSPGNMVSFRKPESERVDLSFELWTQAGGGTIITNTVNYTTLTFSVIGVE